MLIETVGKAIELMNNSIPYPEQIKNIDLDKKDVIYFTWRSQRYRLELHHCSVDSCHDGMLHGDDCSILLTKLLQNNLGRIR